MTPSPWKTLPTQAPYVLATDSAHIEMFNKSVKARDPQRLRTELLPEPFVGSANAPVVILLLNPGFSRNDARHHKRPEFRKRLLSNLHDPWASTHAHLSDDLEGPGNWWWCHRACRRLIEEVGLEVVATNLLAVEFFPYHSQNYGHSHLRLPSQNFSFELVLGAMDRGAEIVCGRGRKEWFGAIPTLSTYPKLCHSQSPRQLSLTEGNIPRYRQVVSALKRG